MLDRQPILEPPHPKPRVVKVDLVAAEADRLADARTMTKHRENEEMIANSVATGLGGVEQGGDFRLARGIGSPLMRVRGGHRDTFYISPAEIPTACAIGIPWISCDGSIALFTECGFLRRVGGALSLAMVTEPPKVKNGCVAAPLGAMDSDAFGSRAHSDEAPRQPAQLRRAAGVLPRSRAVSANCLRGR